MTSTIKVGVIQEPSSATANITLDSSGNAAIGANLTVAGSETVTGTVVMGSSFKRNRLINGNMLIDQRNAGASVTPTATSANTYLVDRWMTYITQASKLTFQQNAGSVTPPAGFKSYLGVTSTSSYSVASSDVFVFRQAIEGFNVADLGWGTASAQAVTLSFWVRSSLTGTFGGSIANDTGARSYAFSFTISSANTWTQISVTVPGDTSGTWLSTNGIGMLVGFNLGAGSSALGTADVWTGSYLNGPTGAINIVGTSGATFYITGVQLEVGTKATPYEMQIYSDQLAQCQRYYAKSYDVGTVPGTQVFNGEFLMQTFANNNLYCAVRYPVTMRTDPTLTFYPGYGAGASPVAGNFWNYSTSANIASAVGRVGSTGYSIEKNTGSASATIGWQYTASAEL